MFLAERIGLGFLEFFFFLPLTSWFANRFYYQASVYKNKEKKSKEPPKRLWEFYIKGLEEINIVFIRNFKGEEFFCIHSFISGACTPWALY